MTAVMCFQGVHDSEVLCVLDVHDWCFMSQVFMAVVLMSVWCCDSGVHACVVLCVSGVHDCDEVCLRCSWLTSVVCLRCS